jgi:glycerophosphoryl diester phosphodiesterase
LNPLSDYPFFGGEKPRIIGHRGAAGTSPENTFPSFQRALEEGAKFIELDVRSSEDGEIVIIHDATLERTTNGRGPVRKKSLRELKVFDAAYWLTLDGGASYPYRGQQVEIPTLEDYLSFFPQARTIIEIKQSRPAIVKRVIEIVHRLGKEQSVLLATEKDKIMREIRKELQNKDLHIATGFSYGEVADFFYWAAGGKKSDLAVSGQAMQIPCEYGGMVLVSEATASAAHELGVEMFVWTVNSVKEIERLLDLGVDGIITDYPSRLHDTISRRRA